MLTIGSVTKDCEQRGGWTYDDLKEECEKRGIEYKNSWKKTQYCEALRKVKKKMKIKIVDNDENKFSHGGKEEHVNRDLELKYSVLLTLANGNYKIHNLKEGKSRGGEGGEGDEFTITGDKSHYPKIVVIDSNTIISAESHYPKTILCVYNLKKQKVVRSFEVKDYFIDCVKVAKDIVLIYLSTEYITWNFRNGNIINKAKTVGYGRGLKMHPYDPDIVIDYSQFNTFRFIHWKTLKVTIKPLTYIDHINKLIILKHPIITTDKEKETVAKLGYIPPSLSTQMLYTTQQGIYRVVFDGKRRKGGCTSSLSGDPTKFKINEERKGYYTKMIELSQGDILFQYHDTAPLAGMAGMAAGFGIPLPALPGIVVPSDVIKFEIRDAKTGEYRKIPPPVNPRREYMDYRMINVSPTLIMIIAQGGKKMRKYGDEIFLLDGNLNIVRSFNVHPPTVGHYIIDNRDDFVKDVEEIAGHLTSYVATPLAKIISKFF
jgi:hypothetical protein